MKPVGEMADELDIPIRKTTLDSIYYRPEKGINYDIYSWGPDKLEGSDDDIYQVDTSEDD